MCIRDSLTQSRLFVQDSTIITLAYVHNLHTNCNKLCLPRAFNSPSFFLHINFTQKTFISHSSVLRPGGITCNLILIFHVIKVYCLFFKEKLKCVITNISVYLNAYIIQTVHYELSNYV